MNRGVSSGGGQSSLGYLFGSGEGKQPSDPPPSPSKVNITPPYGLDKEEEDQALPANPPQKQVGSNNRYRRTQGRTSGNVASDRPSTKVKSVPGGNSSIGYLFGDK